MFIGSKWMDKFGFLSGSKLRGKVIADAWPMNHYMSGPGR